VDHSRPGVRACLRPVRCLAAVSMKHFPLRLLAIALGLVWLTSCRSHIKLGGVVVSIVELKPVATAAALTQATLTLQYTNENVVPIGTTSSTHKLSLNGVYVGKAVSNDPVGLPPRQRAKQDVTVRFEHPEQIQALLKTTDPKNTTYRLETDIVVMDGEDRNDLYSTHEGTVDLRALASGK
jgi:LEA14-like dessication related protein